MNIFTKLYLNGDSDFCVLDGHIVPCHPRDDYPNDFIFIEVLNYDPRPKVRQYTLKSQDDEVDIFSIFTRFFMLKEDSSLPLNERQQKILDSFSKIPSGNISTTSTMLYCPTDSAETLTLTISGILLDYQIKNRLSFPFGRGSVEQAIFIFRRDEENKNLVSNAILLLEISLERKLHDAD